MNLNEPLDSPSDCIEKEHVFKVLVVGDVGTGKTSVIARYVHNIFSEQYKTTIGVDFALKILQWDDSTIIKLQMWDVAGQERFGNLTRVYYKEAVAAYVVFDVTRMNTFENALKWKYDIDSKVFLPDDSPIPVVLLANKCDLADETSISRNHEKMDEFCKENGFIGWFETSAKNEEGTGIDESTKFLVQRILDYKPKKKNVRGGVNINQKPQPEEDSCIC